MTVLAWPPLVIPTGIDQTLDSKIVHQELREKHWAWQPLQQPKVPELSAEHPLAQWARTDVDASSLRDCREWIATGCGCKQISLAQKPDRTT